MDEEPGFWKWREHFLNTTSAQLAVLPLLLLQFGFFSPLGIISNVLILELIPITMALGFFIGFAAIFSGALAWIISWPTSVFLAYELGIIHLCAKIINFLI
jgi:predicted membrane metal-binding protein